MRLKPDKTPIGRTGRFRRWAAWTFTLTGMCLFGAMLFLTVAAALNEGARQQLDDILYWSYWLGSTPLARP
jgi:hypothetical protein